MGDISQVRNVMEALVFVGHMKTLPLYVLDLKLEGRRERARVGAQLLIS